jgi:hypothetical protein
MTSFAVNETAHIDGSTSIDSVSEKTVDMDLQVGTSVLQFNLDAYSRVHHCVTTVVACVLLGCQPVALWLLFDKKDLH